MAEIKAKQDKPREAARVSTTEAEATGMTMADGGDRPAYNAQFTSDTASRVIVGVEAVTLGTDMARLTPMIEQVGERTGRDPETWLVDGGYCAHQQIEQAAEHTTVYAPVPKPKDPNSDPYARKDDDSDALGDWRERMGREEAKVIYTKRARPRPNASTSWPASAASPACACAARPRCVACCCSMPWPTT
jgi:hypothetical protein